MTFILSDEHTVHRMELCEIAAQERLGGGYLNLVVRSDEVVAVSRPGHFAMLRSWPGSDPLLPRPFSFARLDRDAGTFEILYRVVGRGTELLSCLEEGDRITVLAPLGQPFTLPESGRIALIGRGLGIAPLIAVADEAAERGLAVDCYLSARHGAHVPGLRELEPLAENVFIQADDAVAGPALVTDHLARELGRRTYAAAYTCGSRRLGVALQQLQRRYGFAAYVSLETHMACGFGACKACVWPIRTNGEVHLVRTCYEGPVFPLERVVYIA